MGCLKLDHIEKTPPLKVVHNILKTKVKCCAGAYRYGYQGQFAEKDEETGWNSFEARQWDARIGRWMAMDSMGQFYSPYVGMGNNPVVGIDPTGGICPTCPKGAGYDAYRNSADMFRYAEGVGAFYDIGEIMVLGSSSFEGVQTVFGSSRISVGDMMDLQRDLNNIENTMATFNPENMAMILMIAEGGGVSGGGARKQGARMMARGVVQTELKFTQQQLWKKFGEHIRNLV